jgi:hypothetical protein
LAVRDRRCEEQQEGQERATEQPGRQRTVAAIDDLGHLDGTRIARVPVPRQVWRAFFASPGNTWPGRDTSTQDAGSHASGGVDGPD